MAESLKKLITKHFLICIRVRDFEEVNEERVVQKKQLHFHKQPRRK